MPILSNVRSQHLRELGFAIALALLSGCFESEELLFGEEDIVTPLPDSFAAAMINNQGVIINDGKPMAFYTVRRDSTTYVATDSTGTETHLVLAPLQNNSFIFATPYSDEEQGQARSGFLYGLLTLTGDRIDLVLPDAMSDMGPTLRRAGVSFQTREGDFGTTYSVFDDPVELGFAARIALSELAGEGGYTYRVATGAEAMLALEEQSRMALDDQVASAAAPQVPPSNVPSQVMESNFSAYEFANPDFLQAIFDGSYGHIDKIAAGPYASQFINMFIGSEIRDCQYVVSDAALFALATQASIGNVAAVFGGFADAHSSPANGLGEAFEQGAQAGAETFGGMIFNSAAGESDAQRFYDHYGCSGSVAEQFFDHLEDYALGD